LAAAVHNPYFHVFSIHKNRVAVRVTTFWLVFLDQRMLDKVRTCLFHTACCGK